MLSKRILGIFIIVIGASLIASSFYINSRVKSGREQISQAQDTVRQGKHLFSLNPITKEVGKGITDSAERKISEGSEKANRYAVLALWFQIGGSILIVAGGGIIFLSRNKKIKK